MSVSANNSFFGSPISSVGITGTSTGSVNIDGGINTGFVFDGDAGGDFLNPNKIQGTLNDFGGSIGGSDMIFGDNPNSIDILKITKGKINDIFAADFFPAFSNVRVLNHPSIQPIPDISGNVKADDILAASTFFQVGVELSPTLYNPLQHNPYLWNGPSANDIFTGSLISQNNILGGNFSWPNGFPNSIIGTGGVHMANPYPQFTGLPYFGNVFGNPYGNNGNNPFSWMGSGMLPGAGYNPFGGIDAESIIPGLAYNPFNMGAGGLLSGFNYPGMSSMSGGGSPYQMGGLLGSIFGSNPFGGYL